MEYCYGEERLLMPKLTGSDVIAIMHAHPEFTMNVPDFSTSDTDREPTFICESTAGTGDGWAFDRWTCAQRRRNADKQ